MVRSLIFGLVAASLTSAHFTLNWPPTAGFIDENEPNAPCGGATVTVNNDSQEINVDRFPVSIFSSHPAGSWSFFATTVTQEPYNWTEIVPVINSTGIGSFCLTYLRAPAEFAGQNGVLQVIDSSADGTLYQCAPVNFVSGGNNTVNSEFCTNQTSGFDAVWTGASSTVAESSSNTSTSDSSDTHAGHSNTTSSTSSAGAAAATAMGSVLGLGFLAVGLAL